MDRRRGGGDGQIWWLVAGGWMRYVRGVGCGGERGVPEGFAKAMRKDGRNQVYVQYLFECSTVACLRTICDLVGG
jgi:hypothetical protein